MAEEQEPRPEPESPPTPAPEIDTSNPEVIVQEGIDPSTIEELGGHPKDD